LIGFFAIFIGDLLEHQHGFVILSGIELDQSRPKVNGRAGASSAQSSHDQYWQKWLYGISRFRMAVTHFTINLSGYSIAQSFLSIFSKFRARNRDGQISITTPGLLIAKA
jgi:hypothetical protein